MRNMKDLLNQFSYRTKTEIDDRYLSEDRDQNQCTIPIAPETTVLAAGLIGAAALIVVATVATTMILDN